eukprot:NODE_6303_length_859_cov_101.559783_g6070_i0.p1 GENE.NODE_6303_length_859_cov_101.559783_g6070_i0~~NODE_6303_length_859_cov_101.559783_g6070_i0.p1  ORF type:complete len:241 (+),score=47.22 NODE_6303_length_859_cov_101.559783_g6070_i0:80-724(+)
MEALPADEQPCVAVATKRLLQILLASGFADLTSLHACCRVVLVMLDSEWTMPDPVAYENLHPQGETSGMDRIAEIGKYKECYRLVEIVRGRGGQITKLAGRTFCSTVFPDLKTAILEGKKSAKVEELITKAGAIFPDFLERFETELKTDASLCWARDYDTKLSEQRQERLKAVQERVEQTAAVKDEITAAITELPDTSGAPGMHGAGKAESDQQ